MPYDPRMLQMAQMGVGMMGPQQSNPFADARNQPPRPKQWWEQPMPQGQASQMGGTIGTGMGADPAQPGASKGPPSLLDMMMNFGKMTRPQYDKAIAGQGGTAQGYGMVSPWAFLGSMGLPGGAGWGGSGSGGPG